MSYFEVSRKILLPMAILLALFACAPQGPLKKSEEKLFWELEQMDSGFEFKHEAVCSLHNEPTELRAVPTFAGFYVSSKQYMKAKVRLFPNSFLKVWTGSCEDLGTYSVVRWVCQNCREAEEQYLQQKE